ncbi:hypothetical protein V1477_001644 [Vespula maculifrons]|uniref:Uncharacterized protein n=1 Tax=Vespula maculifrons TaxID=7453 RepID=A0ABD2CYC5_VESMC
MDIEKKRKEKMNLTKVGIRKSCWIFSSRRRRPAQKPTPMSPTHGTHPRESIIIKKILEKSLKRAAIRSVILVSHKMSTSHHEEVAAAGDPRANGDSTLRSTIRDAFPLRELRASQQTGDIAPLSTPSASDISRHDRSCLFRFQKSKRSPRSSAMAPKHWTAI